MKVYLANPYPDLDLRADDHSNPLAEPHRVSLERYAVFCRHLAGTDSPFGTMDRGVIKGALAHDGQPPSTA